LCNFTNVIRGIFHACFLGYKLDERSQGQGYMTEALTGAIDYMFAEQRLHRIQANYMPHNQRSAAVLRRLGFTVEGTARKYLFIGGEWRDHVLTSLTNPDSLVTPK
jgi:ribosomal-protein-alanine N-acetyltransferase